MVFFSDLKGENIWRNEDILKIIEDQGDSIALIFFSGNFSYSLVVLIPLIL